MSRNKSNERYARYKLIHRYYKILTYGKKSHVYGLIERLNIVESVSSLQSDLHIQCNFKENPENLYVCVKIDKVIPK